MSESLIQRDDSGVAHIVALSGGKDSTAMALRLAEMRPHTPFTYICTPTGNELPEMFAHWRRLSELLGQRIVPITNGTLASVCRDQKAIPNHRMRFCTRILKIEPFKRVLAAAIPAAAYVGLRADEAEREGADYGGDVQLSSPGGVVQQYPLREWGWGLTEVVNYLNHRGVEIPERTDCALCFWQKLGEWHVLWRDHPDLFAEGERLEQERGYTFRSRHRDSWPASLSELRQRFEAGDKPDISLRMMEKRRGMCRTCTL